MILVRVFIFNLKMKAISNIDFQSEPQLDNIRCVWTGWLGQARA